MERKSVKYFFIAFILTLFIAGFFYYMFFYHENDVVTDGTLVYQTEFITFG